MASVIHVVRRHHAIRLRTHRLTNRRANRPPGDVMARIATARPDETHHPLAHASLAQVSELPDAGLQGYSLAPFLNLRPKRGSLAARPAHVVVEYAGEEVNAPQFMLRLGDLKLIQYGEQPPFISYPPQLFNVRPSLRRANFCDRH